VTFLDHRPFLRALAYRLLGSWHDAEDVLQDAFVRWSRADRTDVDEPRRYLTRVVTRLAVDRLRARARETYVGPWLPEPVATDPSPFGTVDTSDLSIAMLHLMERLTPPQRAVYVLRTAFGVDYPEIARIVGRPAEHCRQLHHRAAEALAGRQRFSADRTEASRLVAAFAAAARRGDLTALERLLHTDVEAWSDGGGRVRAARRPVVGARKVARFFAAVYAKPPRFSASPVEVNGQPALVVRYVTREHVLAVAVTDGLIGRVYLVANPAKLRAFLAQLRPFLAERDQADHEPDQVEAGGGPGAVRDGVDRQPDRAGEVQRLVGDARADALGGEQPVGEQQAARTRPPDDLDNQVHAASPPDN
jgi:RNA polymerase sigma factor (sigma-70 family)